MNWALLIAEYPRSMLKDELSLIVLVFIERGGLTTEDELSSRLSMENHELKQTLFDLHLNQFIEYSKHHMRVTERGKRLIDRSQLSDDILEDLLNSLSPKYDEREIYKTILQQYRDTSFRYYLNSLGSIKTWENICILIYGQHNMERELSEIQIGKWTLLLRDLRNWWQHSYPDDALLDRANVNLKILLKSHDLPDAKITRSNDEDIVYATYFELLNGIEKRTLYPLLREPKRVPQIRYGKISLLLALHDFQAASEPDCWYDDLYESRLVSLEEKNYSTSSKYLQAIRKMLTRESESKRTAKSKYSQGDFKEKWSPNQQIPGNTSNFLELLMIAKTLDELKGLTGLRENLLKSLLTEISTKCDSLLGTEIPPESQANLYKDKMEYFRQKTPAPSSASVRDLPASTEEVYAVLVQAIHLARERGYVSSFSSLKPLMKELMGGQFDESYYKDSTGKPFAKFKDFVLEAERRGKVQVYTYGTINEVFLPDEDPYKLSQFAKNPRKSRTR